MHLGLVVVVCCRSDQFTIRGSTGSCGVSSIQQGDAQEARMVSLGIGIRLVFLGTAASCPRCVCICRSLGSSVLVRRKPHKLEDAMPSLTWENCCKLSSLSSCSSLSFKDLVKSCFYTYSMSRVLALWP